MAIPGALKNAIDSCLPSGTTRRLASLATAAFKECAPVEQLRLCWPRSKWPPFVTRSCSPCLPTSKTSASQAGPTKEQSVNDMLDQLIAWGSALKTLGNLRIDQGGEKMKVIEDYRRALRVSDEYYLNRVLLLMSVSRYRLEQFRSAGERSSLSVESGGEDGSWNKCTLKAAAEQLTYWSLKRAGGTEVSGDRSGATQPRRQIDHIIIYMRPIPVALKFAVAIMQRLQLPGRKPSKSDWSRTEPHIMIVLAEVPRRHFKTSNTIFEE